MSTENYAVTTESNGERKTVYVTTDFLGNKTVSDSGFDYTMNQGASLIGTLAGTVIKAAVESADANAMTKLHLLQQELIDADQAKDIDRIQELLKGIPKRGSVAVIHEAFEIKIAMISRNFTKADSLVAAMMNRAVRSGNTDYLDIAKEALAKVKLAKAEPVTPELLLPGIWLRYKNAIRIWEEEGKKMFDSPKPMPGMKLREAKEKDSILLSMSTFGWCLVLICLPFAMVGSKISAFGLIMGIVLFLMRIGIHKGETNSKCMLDPEFWENIPKIEEVYDAWVVNKSYDDVKPVLLRIIEDNSLTV